jgi:hypothetical protein
LVVAVLAIVGVVVFFLTRDGGDGIADSDETTETVVDVTTDASVEATTDASAPDRTGGPVNTGEIPPAEQEPEGLGDDPELNTLADDCFGGDMAACDELYFGSPAGSPYEAYGDSCAGRQPEGTGTKCVTAFPGG